MAKLMMNHFGSQDPNYSGFEVIGAGLPRTGTSSLRMALCQLLNGACYHMANVFQGTKTEWNHWENALKDLDRDDKVLSKKDWEDFFQGRGFRAGVDYPVSLFYKELMEVYPNAKVILTVRDDAKGWHRSVNESILAGSSMNKQFTISMFQRLMGMKGGAVIAEKICRYAPKGCGKGVFGVAESSVEESAEFYNNWIEEVRRTVPADRLLVFNVKQGWKPLCDFLGLPVPSNPFPHENDAMVFQRMLKRIKIASFVVVWVLPVTLASIGYVFRNTLRSYLPF